MSSWRLDYTSALEASEQEAIVAALTDDVVIRVAVHDAPMRGRDMARFLFGVLSEELDPLRPYEEIIEGPRAVVLFETAIGEKPAQGLNVVGLDHTGLVRELTVFFRPLESLELIAEAVGARMAARFGPPPE
jgi:hypothetical protein